METIVEAIRHLEGDHLFSDDHNNSAASSPSPVDSPREMEICSSGSSPTSHHSQAQSNVVITMEEVPMVEIQTLSTTATNSNSTNTVTSLKHLLFTSVKTETKVSPGIPNTFDWTLELESNQEFSAAPVSSFRHVS